jgi:hypothetical protein
MRIVLLAAILATCPTLAQTFDRSYGNAYPWEEITAGRTLERSGLYYSLYRQRQYNSPNAFMTFQAMDQQGDTLFTRRLLDTVHPYVVFGFEKSHTTNDFFASGKKQNQVALPYTTAFLARYNTQGDTVWYREYSNSDTTMNFLTGLYIDVDAEDHIAMVGYTYRDTVQPYDDGPIQIYLMKCDSAGNRLWDRTYGDPLLAEQPSDIVSLPDGGYLVVGYTIFSHPFPQPATLQSFLIRTDSVGNELWLDYLPEEFGSAVSISRLGDGGFLLSGAKCNSVQDTCGGMLSKIDEWGDVLWQHFYPGHDIAVGAEFWDAGELPNGNLIAGGESDGPDTLQGWVMKTDANGNMLWQRFIDKTPTYDSFTRITACSDGGILLTGQMQRDQLSDVWLVKIDSLGCDSAGCPEDIHTGVTPVVTSSECDKGDELMAIPNPSNGHLQLRGAWLSGLHSAQVEILDATGRLVFSKEVEANEAGMLDVGLTDQPTGLYIATVRTMTGDISTVRIAIQR